MNLLQDVTLVETIVTDIAEVASGQQVTGSKEVDGFVFTGTVEELPNGPEGTDYQVITGGWWSILRLAFADATAFANGGPVKVAEKVGTQWFGTTFSGKPVTPPAH